jgi:hypothetical protein
METAPLACDLVDAQIVDGRTGARAATLADLSRSLVDHADDFDTQWLLVLDFFEGMHQTAPEARGALLVDRPVLVDGDRWDVFLGAMAEHHAIRSESEVPAWSNEPGHRWCGRMWFLSDLPSQKLWALAWSPASFRARGIFLHPDELTRDGVLA